MNHFFVRRQRATNTGERGSLILEGSTHNRVDLKTRRRLDDGLHPVEIADARQLNQDLIGAQAVGRNLRLAHAERIHAIVHRLDSLLDGLVFKGLFDQRFHGEYKARVRTTTSEIVLAGILGIKQRAGSAHAGLRYALNANGLRLVRVRLVHLRKREVGSFKVLLNPANRVVGLRTHRLRHHNLQNQVGSASEIKTEVNPAAERIHKGFAAHAGGDSKDSVQANQQHRNNQCNLVLEILLHGSVSLVQIAKKIRPVA